MSDMIVNWDVESKIKQVWAEKHSVTAKSWKSNDFLEFRKQELENLNKKFNDFLTEKGPNEASFYENMNPVYQKNVNNQFLKKEGLKQSRGKRIKNWFSLNSKEAEGENLQTSFGRAYQRLGTLGLMQSAVYKFGHMVERSGVNLTKLGSRLAKNTKYMPLSQIAGATCVAFGAELAVGGAICKSMINPEYPFLLGKQAVNKFKHKKEKTQTSDNKTLQKDDNLRPVQDRQAVQTKGKVNMAVLRGIAAPEKAPVTSTKVNANAQLLTAIKASRGKQM